MITPVLLCGGSGNRLWPLSRRCFPKQFVPLIEGRSLFDLTLDRLKLFETSLITVALEEHRFVVAEALELADLKSEILLEPEGRDTAAAMAIACLLHSERHSVEDLLLFCPADHFITDDNAFYEMVISGASAAADGAIVTFGINPSEPSSSYGYLQTDVFAGEMRSVTRFIEKPSLQEASNLLKSRDIYWNAGLFLCSAKTLLGALHRLAPEILRCCRTAMEHYSSHVTMGSKLFTRPNKDAFLAAPSLSIDYAVMEKSDQLKLIPFQGMWADIGSWDRVTQLVEKDKNGHRILGQGIAFDSSSLAIRAPHRPVVALGVDDLLIVDTADAVLVVHKEYTEKVRDIVGALQTSGFSQALDHRKVHRPWGWYDLIDQGPGFQVKRLWVRPGAALSLQRHNQRAEHWIVVRGRAKITCGDQQFYLDQNQSTYIPQGEKHRLENPDQTDLEVIEVQSGAYLGEDDIEVFDDDYGRHDH